LSKRGKKYKRNTRIKKSKKARILLIAMVMFFIVFCFALMWLKRSKEQIYVKKINVEGTNILTSYDILRNSGLNQGCVLKTTERRKILEKLRENVWIEDASLIQGPFGTLTLAIHERMPIAIVRNPEPSLLCSDGKIIPFVSGFDSLPLLHFDSEKSLLPYVARIQKIKEVFGSRKMEICFMSNDMTLIKVDGFKIIIGRRESLFLWSGKLDKQFLSIKLFKIIDEERRAGYKSCDMRFRNQIIFEKGGA